MARTQATPFLMIALSFDQDWAPHWAVEDIHDRLDTAGLRGTLFVTNNTPTLDKARKTGTLELGWHPNFLPGSSHGDTVDAVLGTMKALVPEAVGARAHYLVRGTHFLQAYQQHGLRYDAADLRDGEAGLRVFQSWTGMARIPIWFEDDVHLQRGLTCQLSTLDLASRGLKVFNFHPTLVALNAGSLDRYNALKESLREQGTRLPDASREQLAPFTHNGQGMSTLLDEVIRLLQSNPDRAVGPLSVLGS